MTLLEELELMRNKVSELEEQVEHLRISRRVLMSLIERIEREKRVMINNLEKENKRLQQENKRYAKWIWNKNKRIIELETKGNISNDLLNS